MKIVLAAVLLFTSTLASAGFVSGAVGGAVGGAVAGSIVSSGNKTKVVQSQPAMKMVVGRTILVCKLDHSGECYELLNNKTYPPLKYAGVKGFSLVHSQELVKCEGVVNYCIIMEVSK